MEMEEQGEPWDRPVADATEEGPETLERKLGEAEAEAHAKEEDERDREARRENTATVDWKAQQPREARKRQSHKEKSAERKKKSG